MEKEVEANIGYSSAEVEIGQIIAKDRTLAGSKSSLLGWYFLKLPGLGLALLPALLMLNYIRELVFDIPVQDEWQFLPEISKLYTGGLTFNDLYAPYQEHRIPLARLLILALAKLTHWNVTFEYYLVFAIQPLILLVLWQLLRQTVAAPLRLGLLAVSSLFIFSAVQMQTAYAGLQIVWFMLILGVALAVRCSTWGKVNWLSLGGSAFGAMVATYSITSGLLVWGVVLAGFLVQKQTRRRPVLLFWLSATLLCYGVYLYNYQPSRPEVAHIQLGQASDRFLTFFLAYLGLPLGIWGVPGPAAVYGAGGLLLLAASSWWLWRRAVRQGEGAKAWASLLPWLLLALFVALNAALTALGRAAIPYELALHYRYTTVGLLFWLSTIVIVTLASYELYQQLQAPRRLWLAGAVLLGLAVLGASYTVCYLQGYEAMRIQSNRDEVRRFYFYDYREGLRALPPQVYGNPQRFEGYAAQLEGLGTGPFRVPKEEYYRSLEQGWRERLSSTSYSVTAYPLEGLSLTQGKPGSSKVEDGIFKFERLAKTPVNILGQVNFLKQARREGWWPDARGQALDIQSQAAYSANIIWFKPGNKIEATAAYGLEDSAGWRHFRVFVPTDITAFRIDLVYRGEQPLADAVKLDLYNRKASSIFTVASLFYPRDGLLF